MSLEVSGHGIPPRFWKLQRDNDVRGATAHATCRQPERNRRKRSATQVPALAPAVAALANGAEQIPMLSQKQIQLAIYEIEVLLDALEQQECLDESAVARHWALLDVRDELEGKTYN